MKRKKDGEIRRTYIEQRGKASADWLNGRTPDMFRGYSEERLAMTVQRLRALYELITETQKFRGKPVKDWNLEVATKLNDLLAAYSSRFVFEKLWWLPSAPAGFFEKGFGDDLAIAETSVARDLIELANEGIVDRMRRCWHCGTWLFAGRKDEVSCSKACRQAKYDQKPEVKARKSKQAKSNARLRKVGYGLKGTRSL